MDAEKSPRKTEEPVVSPSQDTDSGPDASTIDGKSPPPLLAKLFAVFLISCISFGSHWSSGVTGAMKSTIKKVHYRTSIIMRIADKQSANASL